MNTGNYENVQSDPRHQCQHSEVQMTNAIVKDVFLTYCS